ncbi:hypothetical protein SAMN05421858_2740 [Haladaptatus litoreus]|uniref:Uncharacterized protein n=1 Tax=Haladaptatus litoreus TaxID=553468 RepID=A0A1N7BT34_9EURY|nr:hypothetical protein SAMN05421858_2740 [Haladaptatus litoreus]
MEDVGKLRRIGANRADSLHCKDDFLYRKSQ